MSARRAVDDLWNGLKDYHIWTMLAWSEIKQRYRRSVIGPFWLTLSTSIMVFAMGPLYGGLFGQSLDKYFMYLATSIIVWGLVSSSINDACQVFIGSEGFIKQSSLPLSVYVLRLVWRNLIIFLHNVVVVIAVGIFFPPEINLATLLVIPGLIIMSLNAVWAGIVIGLICARYRDVTQIVNSIVGIAFFVTPVMWYPRMLGQKEWMVNLNPLYHFMQILRAPMIGEPIAIINWVAASAVTVVGFVLMIMLFGRYRSRIAYWV